MNLICRGQKSKVQVVQETVGMYERAFECAERESSVLVSSCGKFMTESNEPRVSNEPRPIVCQCPSCQKGMTLRELSNGSKVVGCTGYPACKESIFVPSFVEKCDLLLEPCPTCA